MASQGRTMDPKLEKKNFAHAGKVLAEILPQTMIQSGCDNPVSAIGNQRLLDHWIVKYSKVE